VDPAGNAAIADTGNNRILIVAASTGTFGDGGPATQAGLNDPTAVTVDHAGNLVIAASANNRIRVVAVRTGTFYGTAMTAGDIYTVAGGGPAGFAGDGGPATKAGLTSPWSVAINGPGGLVIADTGNQRIRVVS